MSTPLSYQIHSGSNGNAGATNTSIGTGTVATFAFGPNTILRIVASTPVNIRFGTAAITVATANDILIPANVPEFFDMGGNTGIAIFAVATSVVNISVVSRT